MSVIRAGHVQNVIRLDRNAIHLLKSMVVVVVPRMRIVEISVLTIITQKRRVESVKEVCVSVLMVILVLIVQLLEIQNRW